MIGITSENADTKIIEVEVEGKITRESIDQFYTKLEERGSAWGKVNLLEKLTNIQGFEPGAFWRDLTLFLKNRQYFNKVALVTDKGWAETLVKLAKPISKIDIQVFHNDQITTARQWLAA